MLKEIFEIIFKVLYFFFLPGYSLLYALLLGRDLNRAEIIILSFLLSLGVVPTSIYVVHRLFGIDITFINNGYIVGLVIIIALSIGVLVRVGKEERIFPSRKI